MQFLDELELYHTFKTQLHIGVIYKYKQESMKRSTQNYKAFSKIIKERSVI
jgi:hypothetical protein